MDQYGPININVLATGLKDDCTITVLNVGTRRSSKHVFRYDEAGNLGAFNLIEDEGPKLLSIFRTTPRDTSASPPPWTQTNLVNEYSLSATAFIASPRPGPHYSGRSRSKDVEKQLI